MTRHEALAGDYARELRAAKTRAEGWWAALIAHSKREGIPIEVVRERWPDGAASHPWVVAVVRKYWLACEELNEEIEREGDSDVDSADPEYVLDPVDELPEDDERDDEGAEEEVYPHIFVLEWLMTEENDDLADFLGSMSYWPVGLDQDERYT
jgi:hypothetical protein